MSDKEKPFELKPEAQAIYDKLKIVIDPKTGLATQDEDAYITSAPEGLTAEIVKEKHKYDTNFVLAQGKKFGEESVAVMKKNPELDRTELVIEDPAKNKFSFTFDRSKQVGPPGGEKTERFGVLNASFEIRAARKTGQMGHLRTHLSELATKSLAKKK